MKIRNPRTIARVARVVASLARGWLHTTSFAYRPLTTYLMADRPDLLGNARYIYTSWHETLLAPTYVYARPDTTVLIGQHADGEMLTQVIRRFGVQVVRGSTTRGGAVALLRLLRDGATRHFALTPDGPRGPRRVYQLGSIYLASRTGVPIVAVGFGFGKAWRARSWDRFAVPKPFSRIRCVTAHAVHVPAGLSAADLEPYRQEVEAVQHAVYAVAERWAATGEFDPLGYEPPAGVQVNEAAQKAWPSARLKPLSAR